MLVRHHSVTCHALHKVKLASSRQTKSCAQPDDLHGRIEEHLRVRLLNNPNLQLLEADCPRRLGRGMLLKVAFGPDSKAKRAGCSCRRFEKRQLAHEERKGNSPKTVLNSRGVGWEEFGTHIDAREDKREAKKISLIARSRNRLSRCGLLC